MGKIIDITEQLNFESKPKIKIKNVTILKIKDVMSKTIREIKNVQTKNHKMRMETVLHLRKNQHALKLVQTNKDK